MTSSGTMAEEPPADGNTFGSLDVLFAKDTSTADRARAAKDFGTAIGVRLSVAANAVEQGKDVLTERSAKLLSELAGRLPIRTADALRGLYGDDVEGQAQHVITEAGWLARLVWTAAAAVPGLPQLVQAIKVIAHSAVEIRMVGELYTIYSDSADRDATWLGTVLLSWATGQPVAPGGSAASTSATLVAKIRGLPLELVGGQSRMAVVTSRGREGTKAMVRAGSRMQRRMRLHPSSWAQPGTQSTGAVVLEATTKLAANWVPEALVGAARDRLAPDTSPAPSQAQEASPSDPREALAQAWALHQRTAAACAALPSSDITLPRLSAALTAQERHLQALSQRLDISGLSAPTLRDAEGDGDAGRLIWQAEDSIDVVEDLGAQSRRLQSWSTRQRAALVYLITALVISTLPVAGLVLSSGVDRLALLAAQCGALPWLSLIVGVIAIGPLFRPALCGPVPRHPVIGTWIVLAAHLGTAVAATVVGTLL